MDTDLRKRRKTHAAQGVGWDGISFKKLFSLFLSVFIRAIRG
jgi:hypothetical protein